VRRDEMKDSESDETTNEDFWKSPDVDKVFDWAQENVQRDDRGNAINNGVLTLLQGTTVPEDWKRICAAIVRKKPTNDKSYRNALIRSVNRYKKTKRPKDADVIDKKRKKDATGSDDDETEKAKKVKKPKVAHVWTDEQKLHIIMFPVLGFDKDDLAKKLDIKRKNIPKSRKLETIEERLRVVRSFASEFANLYPTITPSPETLSQYKDQSSEMLDSPPGEWSKKDYINIVMGMTLKQDVETIAARVGSTVECVNDHYASITPQERIAIITTNSHNWSNERVWTDNEISQLREKRASGDTFFDLGVEFRATSKEVETQIKQLHDAIVISPDYDDDDIVISHGYKLPWGDVARFQTAKSEADVIRRFEEMLPEYRLELIRKSAQKYLDDLQKQYPNMEPLSIDDHPGSALDDMIYIIMGRACGYSFKTIASWCEKDQESVEKKYAEATLAECIQIMARCKNKMTLV